MDIRNFFGNSAKPAEKKAKAVSSAPSPPSAQSPLRSSPRKSPRKRAQIASTPAQSSKEKIRKIIEIDGNDSTTDDEKATAQVPKKTHNIANVDVVIDVDVDQGEAEKRKSKASASASPKEKKTRKTIELEDEDDDMYKPPSDSEISGDDDPATSVASPLPKSKFSPANKKNSPRAAATTKSKSTTPTKKKESSPKSKSPSKPKKEPPLAPTEKLSIFNTDDAATECLSGLTFVFSGILQNLSRENAQDFCKILGGRTTTGVSGKTDYLVVGEILENGKVYTEGSKFKRAQELGVIIVKGEEELYGLGKLYSDKAGGNKTSSNQSPKTSGGGNDDNVAAHDAAPPKAAPANPYTKSRPVNPYAKRPAAGATISNPYTKKQKAGGAATVAPPSNQYASSASAATGNVTLPPPTAGKKVYINELWADKYAPQTTRDILGNSENVRKIVNWLAKWEDIFNNPKTQNKSFGGPNGPKKAALLSGPPGIGKTTSAVLVAKESGRDYIEWNASDVRSKKGLEKGLGDVTGSQVLSFGAPSSSQQKSKHSAKSKIKRVIMMDEVDGMGAGDRSGMAELIKMIKSSKVPIICICNDRSSQKVRTLAGYCLDLRFKRPVKTVIARRTVRIGEMEGMTIEQNAAECIAESCGNDIRQVLNCMQMWKGKKDSKGARSLSMTYKNVKERQGEINKDEILRVSMFDATKMLVQGRTGLSGSGTDFKVEKDSLYRRSDAYFVDYSLMGLMVQQNYLKVMVNPYQDTKRSGDEGNIQEFLERMHDAAASMSDFALAEHAVRGGDQNWGLLPFCSMLAVKTGYHAGGENGGFLPGFPEFAGWMGKNSTRGRKSRLLQELNHHMNYKVSGDSSELRLSYLPILRERFLSLMMDEKGAKTTEVIELMDEYGLDRDDVFENLDEFKLDSKANTFASLDSKQKAAFTREYNKGVHKSQALVAEQGVTKTKKKTSGGIDNDSADPDAMNDDDVAAVDSEDEHDNELDAEKIRSMFSKKKKSATKKKATKKKGAKA